MDLSKLLMTSPWPNPVICLLYLTWRLSTFFSLSHSSRSLYSPPSPGWAFWIDFMTKSLANFHSLLLSTPELDVGPYSFSFFPSSLSLPLAFSPPTSTFLLLHSTAPAFLFYSSCWDVTPSQVIGRFGVVTQMYPHRLLCSLLRCPVASPTPT